MRTRLACLTLAACVAGCGDRPPVATSATDAHSHPSAIGTDGAAPIGVEAGFVDVPPRTVALSGRPVTIGATARLFYNLRPADEDAAHKPIFVMSNGFTAETVRAFGTGPTTVAPGGAVVANPTPLTRIANLVYLEPRQAGYSYDVVSGRAPSASDCSSDLFNEYVDAADYLWGALEFLEEHPQLGGPVVWFGESYAGVRVTWVVAYLRGRFDLASYGDPVLAAKIASAQSTRPTLASLAAAQVLLEPWLVGGAHAAAIAGACHDPAETAAVAAAIDGGCGSLGGCDCADQHDRSRYDFAYAVAAQTARENEGSNAHIVPDLAAALLGVPITGIPGLDLADRSAGFKCSAPNPADPNETVPDEAPLVDALGALPSGQWWYLNFTPLQPDTDTQSWVRDWQTQPYEGTAFVDNVHDVPTFVTNGALDLVVPFRALAPALSTILDPSRVDVADAGLGLVYPDGERRLGVGVYPGAGHMITMLAPGPFEADVAAWLPAQ